MEIDERTARFKAIQFREDLNLFTLPVDIPRVCKELGYRIFWEDEFEKGEDAYTLKIDDQYIIFINRHPYPTCRILWTLCHEMSHIILGHYEKHDLSLKSTHNLGCLHKWMLDREADICTEEILMPEEFIKDNFDKGMEQLRKICCVSKESMRIRCENLGLIPHQDKAAE